MGEKSIYETADRTCRHIRKCDKPFGGITVLFSGDWRQCLPIIPKGTKAQIINLTLKHSLINIFVILLILASQIILKR